MRLFVLVLLAGCSGDVYGSWTLRATPTSGSCPTSAQTMQLTIGHDGQVVLTAYSVSNATVTDGRARFEASRCYFYGYTDGSPTTVCEDDTFDLSADGGDLTGTETVVLVTPPRPACSYSVESI